MSESTTSTETARRLSSRLRQHPLMTLRDEMDDLLSRFLGSDDGWFAGRMLAAVDVSETDTAVEIVMDLPGVDPAEVDIRIVGNTLQVRSARKERKEEKGRIYHRAERRRGEIARDILLPCAVEESEVAAEYKEGVLTITLPKCEAAKVHRIVVKH